MANHFVIGIGGTGGRVIRSLRKRIFQDFGGHRIPDIGLEYLYVDSSDEMMSLDDRSWEVLGTNVQLPPASQLRIGQQELQARLSNIQNYPGLQPWIGERRVWQLVPANVVNAGAGGQRRRLGRFLFACNGEAFREQVRHLTRELTQRHQQTGVTYHVVCGLAGGTGGGAIVDVIAQLIANSASNHDRVIVYAILPDANPPANWDSGSYHANGYAALMELNAMMLGQYQPYDVCGSGRRINCRDARFKGVYVVTNENEQGRTINVQHELPVIVSDYLFDKITTVGESPVESLENHGANPETIPGSDVPARARNFYAFGIKRVAVPEEEITEYLSYRFALSALNQLVYNNWSDTAGYRNEARALNYDQIVRDPDNQARWRITGDHFAGVAPVLAQDFEARRTRHWQDTIPGEWQQFSARVAPVVAELDHAETFDELRTQFEAQYRLGYRREGVGGYYEVRGNGRMETARLLVRDFEREMLGNWHSGLYSLTEILTIVQRLRDDIDERLSRSDGLIAQIRGDVADAEASCVAELTAWGRLGLIGRRLQWRGIFERYTQSCIDLYTARTELEATRYAQDLMRQTINELNALEGSLRRVRTRFDDEMEQLGKEIAARLNDPQAGDLKNIFVKFYEPEPVKEVVRRLCINQATMNVLAQAVREALLGVERLGEDPRLERLNEALSHGALSGVVRQVAASQAKAAHDLNVSLDRDRILNVSLIRRLRDRFGNRGEERLTRFCVDLVNAAGVFAPFSLVERGKVGRDAGAEDGERMVTSTIIVNRPAEPDHAEFLARLDAAFRAASTSVLPPDSYSARPHELSIVSFIGNFPVRHLAILPLLRDRYRDRLRAQGDLGRLELHTEDAAADLPDLFIGGAGGLNSLPWLITAWQLGVLREITNGRGVREVVAETTRDDGLPNDDIVLGRNRFTAHELIRPRELVQLRNHCQRLLARDYRHVDARQELRNGVLTWLEELEAAEPDGRRSDAYILHRAAATEIFDRILTVE
ncbi:MAG: hypothetical protein CMO30_20605 [Tistrella sp.]|uniref:Tubulin-like protein n=1 Tax=Tistrella mobilis TaxID=171437 RepID=A0A3B9IDQ1_9PROT|nr:hypothetical protein [Tistrella sp.]HAE46004.1 hypothetical protein [Tistrella mobilis]